MLWEVRFHSDAREERRKLSLQEREAMANAVEKLRVHGPVLPYPHSSDVRGADRLRELRPRSGRSPWRALYHALEICSSLVPSRPRRTSIDEVSHAL